MLWFLNKISKSVSLLLLFSSIAQGQINDAFRAQNAVVWYRFLETTGDILDSGNPAFGPPANLSIRTAGPLFRTPGVLEIAGTHEIRSLTPVSKLKTECQKTNEFTFEVWLENESTVEERTAMDSKKFRQPSRILTFSKGLQDRNFTFGQSYDPTDVYHIGINNSAVEPLNPLQANGTPAANFGNSYRDPLRSEASATILSRNGFTPRDQKIYLTFQKGLARMYLSDQDGNIYLHKEAATGFAGDLSTWRDGAFLVLGNEYIPDNQLANLTAVKKTCDPVAEPACGTNPNRYWKGKLFQVAVYCKALSQEQIFGSDNLKVVKNQVIDDININLNITPQLQKAQEIFKRITGRNTPIYNPLLVQMESRLNADDPIGAAAIASQDSGFYNITLRDFAARMSNRDETISVPLNDFTASIIGAVRDNMSAQKWLYEDFTYIGNPAKAAIPNNVVRDMLTSNNHYEALGSGRFDLAEVLMKSTQKFYDGKNAVANPTPAGLLTSRQWLAAHAVAGTNRRPVEYTLRQFLCMPIEKVADSGGPEDVIGRDIDRFPGGSNSKFITTCRACHTILDGFRPAYAFFTFSNNFVKHSSLVPAIVDPQKDENTDSGMFQNPTWIAKKLNHNETVFPGGRVTENDEWRNNAVYGSNQTTFQWKTTQGRGIAAFGQMISESKQFENCLAHRVFRSVCKRDAVNSDEAMLSAAAKEFSSSQSYNVKYLFHRIVTSKECLGGQ